MMSPDKGSSFNSRWDEGGGVDTKLEKADVRLILEKTGFSSSAFFKS